MTVSGMKCIGVLEMALVLILSVSNRTSALHASRTYHRMNVGQPRDNITGLKIYLKIITFELANGPHIVEIFLVDETAEIGPSFACVIESRVKLSQCTVMHGVNLKGHACVCVYRSIIVFLLNLHILF